MTNHPEIGGEWTTYRLASGELICGEYAFVTDREFFDDLGNGDDVIVETWQLVQREMVRMGPLGLCSTCQGEGVDDGGSTCETCDGTGEEVRP